MKGIQVPKEAPQRVEIVEEPIEKMGGPTYKNVKPKTYQILQQELGGPAAQSNQAPSAQVRSASGCKFLPFVTYWSRHHPQLDLISSWFQDHFQQTVWIFMTLGPAWWCVSQKTTGHQALSPVLHLVRELAYLYLHLPHTLLTYGCFKIRVGRKTVIDKIVWGGYAMQLKVDRPDRSPSRCRHCCGCHRQTHLSRPYSSVDSPATLTLIQRPCFFRCSCDPAESGGTVPGPCVNLPPQDGRSQRLSTRQRSHHPESLWANQVDPVNSAAIWDELFLCITCNDTRQEAGACNVKNGICLYETEEERLACAAVVTKMMFWYSRFYL